MFADDIAAEADDAPKVNRSEAWEEEVATAARRDEVRGEPSVRVLHRDRPDHSNSQFFPRSSAIHARQQSVE